MKKVLTAVNEVKRGSVPTLEEINKVDNDGETRLTWAIRSQRCDYALSLIGLGGNCDTITNTKWTPLSLACKYKLPEVAKELLMKVKEEEHINIVSADRESALTCAINNKMEDIVLELLIKGATVDHITSEGHTRLTLSCRFEMAEVSWEILRRGSAFIKDNINARVMLGETALTMAISNQWSDIAQELLILGAQRDVITDIDWTVDTTQSFLLLGPPSSCPRAPENQRGGCRSQ